MRLNYSLNGSGEALSGVLEATASPRQDDRAAVEKACGLLAAFGSDCDQVVGVSELARRVGLSKSTAHRQLGILQRSNMVERSGRGYRIGRGLRTLARQISDGTNGRLGDVLLPYLVELFEVTRHTVQLAVLEGTDVVCIGKVSGHHTVATPSRVGSRKPAYCTAGGKLLLAYHPRTSAEVLASPLTQLTPRTVRSHTRLAMEMGEIRRRGLAIDFGGAHLGVSCVAAAITSSSGDPIAAMSVCASTGSNITAVSHTLRRIAQVGSLHLRRTTGQG